MKKGVYWRKILVAKGQDLVYKLVIIREILVAKQKNLVVKGYFRETIISVG